LDLTALRDRQAPTADRQLTGIPRAEIGTGRNAGDEARCTGTVDVQDASSVYSYFACATAAVRRGGDQSMVQDRDIIGSDIYATSVAPVEIERSCENPGVGGRICKSVYD
jgi:hypothetical protein